MVTGGDIDKWIFDEGGNISKVLTGEKFFKNNYLVNLAICE